MECGVLNVEPADLIGNAFTAHFNSHRTAIRKINGIKLARVGQAVRHVLSAVCQKVVARLGRKYIERRSKVACSPHHLLCRLIQPKSRIRAVEPRTGTTRKHVLPEAVDVQTGDTRLARSFATVDLHVVHGPRAAVGEQVFPVPDQPLVVRFSLLPVVLGHLGERKDVRVRIRHRVLGLAQVPRVPHLGDMHLFPAFCRLVPDETAPPERPFRRSERLVVDAIENIGEFERNVEHLGDKRLLVRQQDDIVVQLFRRKKERLTLPCGMVVPFLDQVRVLRGVVDIDCRVERVQRPVLAVEIKGGPNLDLHDNIAPVALL